MAIDIRKTTSLALGAALIGGLASAPAFAINDLAQGYALGATVQTPPTAEQATTGAAKSEDAHAKHSAEGKCGEGKCGASGNKSADAKTHAEGKCGEGKCGASKDTSADAKAADKAAGEIKAHAEGKCGEGKCGGNH